MLENWIGAEIKEKLLLENGIDWQPSIVKVSTMCAQASWRLDMAELYPEEQSQVLVEGPVSQLSTASQIRSASALHIAAPLSLGYSLPSLHKSLANVIAKLGLRVE